MAVDEQRLEELMGGIIGDLGSALDVGLILLGERTGMWEALASADAALTPQEAADRAGVHPRYATEWLRAMAAGGYVERSVQDRYGISEEMAFAMADPDGPAVPGACQVVLGALHAAPNMVDRFATGGGFAWHEHHPDLFEGTERFFRPGYAQNLVSSWIPALDGVDARLRSGGRVADVGCGHGASTILMAREYPATAFTGFDYHEASVARAREASHTAGLDSQVTFETSLASEFPGSGYDLVTMFDCLHDMGDPVGAARHVRETLAADGTWMVVEPFAGDDVADNINPIGRVFYAASTLICTPAAMCDPDSPALGAQAGEGRLREVCEEAGFTRVRRAAETPVNLVLEVRP